MEKFFEKICFECKLCKSGACCCEGVEITEKELKRIIKFDPKVKMPWFHKHRKKAKVYSTRVRNGKCVFQSPDMLCLIYKVRPSYCRQFPLEDGKLADFYYQLCDKASQHKSLL